jgi:putative Holliday junction resolvase
MNILAIDYGKKRIGLAWTDTGVGVVLPYGIVSNEKELISLIKKEGIQKVVIGLPTGLDGKENENTKNVRKFGEKIENETKIKIDFVDERFSSAAADRMDGSGASRDEKAAMVILQTYLESRK